METIENKILDFFEDKSNRPKKTPRHESVIQIWLEKEYSPGKVQNSLRYLEELKIILSVKKHIKNVGDAKFYFSSKLTDDFIRKDIMRKIDRTAYWISKYSDVQITKMLGDHLHYLVKNELRAQGFEIIAEKNVRSYKNRTWNRTRHSLDMIAINKENSLEIGVEIKNMLTLPTKSEVVIKSEICQHLGVTPVFACRWMEPYRLDIERAKGYLWQFKNQIYPIGQEKFVTEIRKRFQLPIEVRGELPADSITEFNKWLHT